MYIFQQVVGDGSGWFLTNNRSLTEVATMFQRKLLSKNNIKPSGSQLLVKLHNIDIFPFKQGEQYFLHLEPSTSHVGSMHVKLHFSLGDYVATWYRAPVEPITNETWHVLFNYKPSKYSLTIIPTQGLRPQRYAKVSNDSNEIDHSTLHVAIKEEIDSTKEYGPLELPSPEPPTPEYALVTYSDSDDDLDDDFDFVEIIEQHSAAMDSHTTVETAVEN